jgi:hypothetical protein
MRWTEQVITAHKNRLSERPPDRRGALIAIWEHARSGTSLEPAVEAALELVSDGNANEVELGFYVLMDLALTDPSLRSYVSQLVSHRSAKVRSGLAFHLSRSFPPEFQSMVYGALLRDKAASVRTQTVRRIGMLYFKALLPELHALRATERNARVMEELDYWIPLLELGYCVKPALTAGMLEVTALTGRGVASRNVLATDPHDPQILRVVEELRNCP